MVGIVFGVFYLRTGWLWPVVFAHMLADTLPFL
ncbi:CPBP family glutamic-type intramembrane protease [Variovorax atrisoli 110B]